MKLVQSILTKNPCYTAGRKITVKGLMLHSVGCPQPKASVFIKNWNSPSYNSACVHGFIDGNDGTVYQTLPWNHRGWHCGSGSRGSGNNTHIGVEMCEPACIKYTGGANFNCSDTAAARTVAKRTYAAAVELFAYLCRQYNLNPTADGTGSGSPGQMRSPRRGRSKCLPTPGSARMRIRGIRYTMNPGRLYTVARDQETDFPLIWCRYPSQT